MRIHSGISLLLFALPIAFLVSCGDGESSDEKASSSDPEGLKEIRGTLAYGVQPGGTYGLTDKVIALYKDGSFTSDLAGAFGRGTEKSKATNPKKWGEWRMNKDNKLELKDSGDEKFDTTHGDWITEPGGADHKMDGCFGRISSASSEPYGGNTTVGRATSWCFKKDGRFAHSATGFGSAPNVATSSSGSARGRYRIDHYTARFVYEDGTEVVTAFCYLDDDNEHIAINGKRLILGSGSKKSVDSGSNSRADNLRTRFEQTDDSFNGYWKSDCNYDEVKKIGTISTLELAFDRFAIEKEQYSDNSCSQKTKSSKSFGTIQNGNIVTTSLGMMARKVEFQFGNGSATKSSIVRQGNILYLGDLSEESGQPADLEKGTFHFQSN